MALKDAIAEIVDELQTISDIRRVPDEPPENNDQFPFAVVYPTSGSYAQLMTVEMRALHNVNIELHVSRKDLPRDFALVMKLIDTIPLELMKLHKDGGFSNLDTFGDIAYIFGPLNWAGVDTLGVTYTITDLKIKTDVA
jgi:hypothetical protein